MKNKLRISINTLFCLKFSINSFFGLIINLIIRAVIPRLIRNFDNTSPTPKQRKRKISKRNKYPFFLFCIIIGDIRFINEINPIKLYLKAFNFFINQRKIIN